MEEAIQIKDINGTEKRICINVDSETVDQKFDEFFSSIKKEATAPGWRKGKAPAKILKKYFRKQALGTVSQILISEFYQQSLKDYNLNPTGKPHIENPENNQYLGSFNSDNSYSVEMVVEVLPKLDPIGYDDIELNLSSDDSEAIYQQDLYDLRLQFGESEQITEAGAQEKDTMIIDYASFMNKEPLEGGAESDFCIDSLCNGESSLPEGFEEELLGSVVGNLKEIKASFPPDYPISLVAGNEVDFYVTVKNIIRKKLADIDEDFAIIVGFDSIKDLDDNLRKQAESKVLMKQIQDAENIITDILVTKNDFDVPKSMVEEEKNRIMKEQRMSEEVAAGHSVRNVKRALLFDAIYDKEDNIEIDPEDMNTFLEEQASAHNQNKDDFVSNLYNQNKMDMFMGILKARKVVEFIIDNNKKREEENE